MSTLQSRCATKVAKHGWWISALFVGQVALAQGQRYEITPLFGGVAGGSMKVQQEGQPPQGRAFLGDSAGFGIAGGFHFYDDEGCEDCSVAEFRWLRQNTHLGFKETTPVAAPLAAAFGRTAVTLDHYLADFAHEWNVESAPAVRPFVMASMGAARMLTPVSANTRFVFGLGAGVKIHPQRHWGFRFHVEWLPMVMHSEVQRVACVSGCVIALGGGLLNQFEFALGPVIRF